ncbi:MAG: hypothetical protein AMXMBFR64_35840 [Myxococcales bacterium]
MAFEVGAKQGRVRPSINVTPLVDVVLVLLIIFMVVTPLLTRHFWTQVPVKEKAEQPPSAGEVDPPLVLSLSKEGVVRLNSDTVDLESVRDRLERVLAAREDNVVFFAADDEVPFGRAMDLLDLARAGGAAPLSVLTEPMGL